MALNITKPIERRRSSSPEEVFLPDDNNFPYGWRHVAETLPDGRIAYRRAPLTQADFLDPQEGDQLIQSNIHLQQSVAIYDMLDNRYAHEPSIGVFMDMKMRWSIPGLPEPAPDVAVVPNLKNKEAERGSFDVVKEGTRPCLIVEIMSPHYPGDDTNKVDIYERVGIAEYIIINPYTGAEGGDWQLWGYRLVGQEYQPIEPDEQGRLLSQATGIWFELDESRRWVVLTDATTGERLLTAREEREGRLEERAARLKAEAQAETEAARAATEAQARLEAEARAADLAARLRDLEAKLGKSGEAKPE